MAEGESHSILFCSMYAERYLVVSAVCHRLCVVSAETVLCPLISYNLPLIELNTSVTCVPMLQSSGSDGRGRGRHRSRSVTDEDDEYSRHRTHKKKKTKKKSKHRSRSVSPMSTTLCSYSTEKLETVWHFGRKTELTAFFVALNVMYHSLLYYLLWTIITTDTNFILTPSADSGFVLQFEFRYWIVSWIPKYWIHLPWFVK